MAARNIGVFLLLEVLLFVLTRCKKDRTVEQNPVRMDENVLRSSANRLLDFAGCLQLVEGMNIGQRMSSFCQLSFVGLDTGTSQ